MIILGMVLYLLFQTLSWALEVIGWLALLLPAAFEGWHLRASRSTLFPGPRLAWSPAWVGLTGPLSGMLLLIHWGSIAATVGIFLGALGAILFAWDNEENGVVPPLLVNGTPYMPQSNASLRAYVWSAWRNPTAGLKVWLEGTISNKVKISVTGNSVGDTLTTGSSLWATDGYRWCYAKRFVKPVLGLKGFRLGWLINVTAVAGYRTWPVFGNYP